MTAVTERVNGWTDWTTWNCALWLGNDETLYDLALCFANRPEGYAGLVQELADVGTVTTPDGATWADADHVEMNGLLAELAGD
jgi:hypothetical protein